MSDTENKVDEVTTDVDTDIDTNDDANDEKSRLLGKYGVDIDNFDEDALLKTLKRIEKAESLTVAQKKKLKELESKSSEISSDVMTKADYAMEKFLDKNPELVEYKDELSKYATKGLSLDEAKVLVLNSDRARANREKVNSLGLSDGESKSEMKSITKAELAKIAEKSQSEYNRIRDLMDSGKIVMR